MHYIYTLEVRLMNPNPSVKFTDQQEVIIKAIKHFNDARYQTPHPKTLELLSCSEDVLQMKLTSPVRLETFGRAIRLFTISLLEEPAFAREVIKGQLLRTMAIKTVCDAGEMAKPVDIDSIDDLTFIKSLLDYMYQKRDAETTIYKRKKEGMRQMKQIALECGILSSK